ncbi:MAG: SPFH domain-containing protein [Oscillochloris sp.]|nr:SPFH domain-containing protein [Oscillochloris sp.]
MALLDLVEYNDPTGNALAARIPPDGNGELRLGSQCIVREGQLAFFARDGRLLDMFIPGRHTLETANIPLLINFVKIPFGNRSPFRADVFFVSLKQHTNLRWETKQPIPMRDAQFGMVRLRASGTYIIQVSEPRRLLTAVVGSRSLFTVQDVEAQLQSVIVARTADAIAQHMRERGHSVIDLATEYDEIAQKVTEAVKPDFAALGLDLSRLFVNLISVPEDLERQFDRAGGVAAMGGLGDYTRFKAAEALGDAARTGGDSTAGAGMSLAAGMHLGQLMGQTLAGSGQAPTQPPTVAPPAPAVAQHCTNCGTGLPATAKFCLECGTPVGPKRCANCKTELPANAKFCTECGTAVTRP